jgi:uncharacterized protein with GYD domain
LIRLRGEGLTRQKEDNMATFISLLKFTKHGIENIKESPARLDDARRAFQAFGGELKAFPSQ